MKKYELMTIFKPNLDAEEVDKLIEKISSVIAEFGGSIESTDKVGRKKLAYEINKKSEGYYVVYTFEANPEFITELERIYRITDSVMKFITVRKDV